MRISGAVRRLLYRAASQLARERSTPVSSRNRKRLHAAVQAALKTACHVSRAVPPNLETDDVEPRTGSPVTVVEIQRTIAFIICIRFHADFSGFENNIKSCFNGPVH
jgi:hypothetical protein